MRLCMFLLFIINSKYMLFSTFNISCSSTKSKFNSMFNTSGVSSNFKIDLLETVQVEDNVKCQIHETTVPNTWYSVSQVTMIMSMLDILILMVLTLSLITSKQH